MTHYQVWLACDGGPDSIEEMDWEQWQSMPEEERDRQEAINSQCIGLWYGGIVEADGEDDALQSILDMIEQEDLYITPGA